MGHMLASGVAWALANALARGAHIRVDVRVNRLPPRLRAGDACTGRFRP